MRKIIIYVLCAIATTLSGCRMQSDCNYIVNNRTKSHIGGDINFGRISSVVSSGSIFERSQKIKGTPCFGIADFKLSNLNDTTSIVISDQKTIALSGKDIKNRADTILYNAFSIFGKYTSQWVVTDDLVAIMEYDESLLTEFAEFYKK